MIIGNIGVKCHSNEDRRIVIWCGYRNMGMGKKGR